MNDAARQFSSVDEVEQEARARARAGNVDEALDIVVQALRVLTRRNEELERMVATKGVGKGRRSEKIAPGQLRLLFEELASSDEVRAELAAEGLEEANDSTEEVGAVRACSTTPKRPRRKALPKDLAREEFVHDVDASELTCQGCGRALRHIGDDVSEELELVPMRFKVKRHIVRNYACPRCKDRVVSGPRPVRVSPGGRFGPHLVSHLIVSKYEDHLPLHRQVTRYARQGIELAKSSLGDQVEHSAKLLEPVYRRLVQRVRQAYVVQTDSSGLNVLDRDHPEGIKKGTMWCYVGDRREVVFDYQPTGKGEDGPWRFLKGRRGYVQADAAGVFDRLFDGRAAHAIKVGCWAHARRRFVNLKRRGEVRAVIPLRWIQHMYAIEKSARAQGLSPEQLAALRAQRTRPLLEELRGWLQSTSEREPPSSEMGRACRYSLNNWQALTRFVDDGHLTPDNNLCELQIRSVAVGRKNYLFAGSHAGARRAAILYSVLRTAALCEVDPEAYLADVLIKLAGDWPNKRLDELLPGPWLEQHPEHRRVVLP